MVMRPGPSPWFLGRGQASSIPWLRSCRARTASYGGCLPDESWQTGLGQEVQPSTRVAGPGAPDGAPEDAAARPAVMIGIIKYVRPISAAYSTAGVRIGGLSISGRSISTLMASQSIPGTSPSPIDTRTALRRYHNPHATTTAETTTGMID